jgi:hypothetical protein
MSHCAWPELRLLTIAVFAQEFTGVGTFLTILLLTPGSGEKDRSGVPFPLVYVQSFPTGLGPSLLSLYPDEDAAQPRSHFTPAAGLAQVH